MYNKKRIVFLLPAMRMGGAEKVALPLLKKLMLEYDVTVALNIKEGELLDQLSDNLKVEVDRLWSFVDVVRHDLRHLSVGYLLKDFLYYLNVKTGKNSEQNYRYLVSRSPWQLGHFDIAIGYVANISTQIFSLSDRVDAVKKIAWIHGETNDLKNVPLFKSIYRTFDKIYCVSKISRAHFVEKYPACDNNCAVFYNLIDKEAVLAGAEAQRTVQFDNNSFNILSVGRLSHEKGFDMVPKILRILSDRKIHAKWYLIGDGTGRKGIIESAKALGVEDRLVMLGTLTNPYPYMKACDLYVQPSYEEGYSTTICEVGILGKAIVGTTSSGGIYEQVEDGISSVLVAPTPETLAEAIEDLINNPEKRALLEINVKQGNYCHNEQIAPLFWRKT